MQQKKSTKLVALIALLAILIWVIWTGINFFLSIDKAPNEPELTPEQLEQIKSDLNAQLEHQSNADNNTEEENSEDK